ncbi:hypothetical protein Mal52_37240 [Symmachiella dynata]|uniref:Uncharacterized protein n=1 Tax=Symmachiella dynata TaxID=2527995 RepID=A0A517ZS12_9PLAN|nr:hypothetical protein Mal52_37240 [Symmachiella dynata]
MGGRDISIHFSEYHRNEKLRMTHRLSANDGGLPVPAGFDPTSFPYVRDSTNGGKLARLSAVGSSVLVVPEPGASLVRTVAQRNSIANKFQVVHFEVPPERTIVRPGGGLRRNRFATSSLEIPAFGADRLSPEYVNIRHRVDPNGSITQVPTDLNTLSPSAFANAIQNGGYLAAHFTDDSCDGCVEANVTGLGSPVESLPAFSLVTAIDFFSLADQSEVENDPTVRRVEPLSKGRLPVNPTLPRPFNLNSSAFDRSDTTVTSTSPRGGPCANRKPLACEPPVPEGEQAIIKPQQPAGDFQRE